MTSPELSTATDTLAYEREQQWDIPKRSAQLLAEQAQKNSLLEQFAALADEDNEHIIRATE